MISKKTVFAFILCSFAAPAVFSDVVPMRRPIQPRPVPQPIPAPRPSFSWIDTIPKDTNESGCSISGLKIDARVRGLYARVESELVITNPNPRSISAPVRFPIPDDAVVCGYYLEINGELMPAVAVPKEKARVAFETEVRRGIDPGLVEAVKGNVYQTRVYPVPPNGTRRIKIDYVAPLVVSGTKSAALDLPMPEGRLARREITIAVEQGAGAPKLGGLGDRRFEKANLEWRVESVETDVSPDSNVLVALPELPETVKACESIQDGPEVFFFTSKSGDPKNEKITVSPDTVIVWDASASREVAHDEEFAIIKEIVKGPCKLALLRNTVEPVRNVSGADELIAILKDVVYDGGTSLLLDGVKELEKSPVILFTDAIDTLNLEKDFERSDVLSKAVVFVSGSQRDMEFARHRAKKAIDVRTWSNPPARTFEIDKTESQMPVPKTKPILSIAWAARRVAHLSMNANQNKDELMRIGKEFGIASPVCSLLVLETLEQWIRHDIEPPASMKKLHEEWVEGRKGRMELTAEAKAERHLDALADYWKERKRWHNRDFSKNPNKSSRKAMEERENRSLLRRSFDRHDRHMAVASRAIAGAVCDEAGAPVMESNASVGAVRERRASGSFAKSVGGGTSSSPKAVIEVKKWTPDTPWLKALDESQKKGSPRDEYLRLRGEWKNSPAFILDCAGWFFRNGDKAFGERVISNLAELRIEDAALLRVMAWRLAEGGPSGLEIKTLERVVALRGEDPQSYRDLALANERMARELFEKALKAANEKGVISPESVDLHREAVLCANAALKNYDKTILTPWQRHAVNFAAIALEERNAFAAWLETQREPWESKGTVKIEIPALDERLSGVLDCDMRVVMSWDADSTDVDIHVTEPSGEEAYYSNRLTYKGGWTSKDITDGYGPEEYEIRNAPKGAYKVRAHYFASHQQEVFGPATVTATAFSNWGRPEQKSSKLSIRLDKKKQMIDLGSVSFEK